MNIDQLRKKLKRRAIVMEIGGFRPPADLDASWFGRVQMSLPGEEWPTSSGRPMHALCQLNLIDLPFRTPQLDELAMITIFIGPSELPVDAANGENWCLRAYKDIAELVPLKQVETGSSIKPLPMRPKVIDEDFPCREDVDMDLPEDIDEEYSELFENVSGFKLGGWPTLVQSEIYWAPFNIHPIAPEYVFQIDTSEKANWAWGDNGLGYFGRGMAEGYADEWALQWQCY